MWKSRKRQSLRHGDYKPKRNAFSIVWAKRVVITVLFLVLSLVKGEREYEKPPDRKLFQVHVISVRSALCCSFHSTPYPFGLFCWVYFSCQQRGSRKLPPFDFSTRRIKKEKKVTPLKKGSRLVTKTQLSRSLVQLLSNLKQCHSRIGCRSHRCTRIICQSLCVLVRTTPTTTIIITIIRAKWMTPPKVVMWPFTGDLC